MFQVRSKSRKLTANLISGESIRIPGRDQEPVQISDADAASPELVNMMNAGMITIEQIASPAPVSAPKRNTTPKES